MGTYLPTPTLLQMWGEVIIMITIRVKYFWSFKIDLLRQLLVYEYTILH